MADHYTLRLAPGLRQRLTERARRAHLPERTLAQRYVEEGLRHDAHPLIQFLDGPSGRRASLIGRGLDVWEVIATVRDNHGSVNRAAEYLEVPAGLVEAAVAYCGEYCRASPAMTSSPSLSAVTWSDRATASSSPCSPRGYRRK